MDRHAGSLFEPSGAKLLNVMCTEAKARVSLAIPSVPFDRSPVDNSGAHVLSRQGKLIRMVTSAQVCLRPRCRSFAVLLASRTTVEYEGESATIPHSVYFSRVNHKV